MKRFWQKLRGLLLIGVVLTAQFGLLLKPAPAHAQLVTANPDIIAQTLQDFLSSQVKERSQNAIIAAISSQLINLMMYTVNQMAYTAAVWVSSGGPGESPLFTTERPGTYARAVAAGVAAKAVDQIRYEALKDGVLAQYGLQLSDDPGYLLMLRQGIKEAFVGSAPGDFNFTELSRNYEGFVATVQSGDQPQNVKTGMILGALSQSFTTNEFSNGVKLYSAVLSDAQKEADTKETELIQNDGFQPKTDAVSGNVTLPAAFVRGELERSIERVQNLPFQLGSALPDSTTLSQIGLSLGSVLTNTLLSELMKRMYDGLFEGLGPTISTNPFDPDSAPQFSRERAQQRFKSILSFSPLQVSDYNLLARLSSCPASLIRNSRELYSCAIDSSFASAVGRAKGGVPLTLQEAIAQGYINGNWALIPSSDTARNQDPKCYTYGFCHSNLVKLRKARIIPVGWELAANSRANSASSPITLNQVMNAFNDCNADGMADDNHPWCHLIDPNWVLKAPESQCRTLAYGQTLTSAGSATRAEECVDIQTCIAEDAQGNCIGGYGYCVEEKNVWRFRGDSCPAHYASCLSVTDSTNKKLDILTNTIDYGNCDEESVGCQWYATEKRQLEDGTFTWGEVNNLATDENSASIHNERLYVNRNVETCSEGEAGCTEVLPRANGLVLNVLKNGGFETDADQNTIPDVWQTDNWNTVSLDRTGNQARSGNIALMPPANGLRQYGITLNQSQFYTLSFFTKSSGIGATMNATLALKNEKGTESVDLSGTSTAGSCTFVNLDSDPGLDAVSINYAVVGTEYERVVCTFTTPTFSDKTASVNAVLELRGVNAFVDDIQLEQGDAPTVFAEGYNLGAANFAYYKIAPSYLGCTGSSTDPEECANYARICTEDAVGCEEYTPRNGDPSVTATAIAADFCPQACIGYDTYKQEGTRYEPSGAFPLYFIPSTAQSCSAAAVGCDEFTNLTTGQAEYFTYLRACVTPAQASTNTAGDNEAVFYTWEGTDESGYQLRTWRLLESNLSATYNNYAHVSGFSEISPSQAPCTNFVATSTGIACNDDANGDLRIDSENPLCDEYSDIFSNPDCREFYDAAGGIHYREWSKTVSVSATCSAYRKTDIAGLGRDDNANAIDDGQENCSASGGYFVPESNDCRYYGNALESQTCQSSQNGCREFTGGRSNNSRIVLEELFEGNGLTKWQTQSAATVTYSNESLAASGHSLRSQGSGVWTFTYNHGADCTVPGGCPSVGSILGGNCTVAFGERFCGELHKQIVNGKTYTVSFWARGSGSLEVGLDYASGTSAVSIDQSFGTVALGSDWRQYTIGPIDVRFAGNAAAIDGASLAFLPTGTGVFFLDTIVLREGEGNITLVKNSWNTPAACDVNTQGQLTPQFHLGCSAYQPSAGGNVALKSFSRLCSENDVGCKAFYTTEQSQSPYGAVYNAFCSTLNGNPSAGITDCYLQQNAAIYNTNSPRVCQILNGETECAFTLDFPITASDLLDTRFEHIRFAPETQIVETDSDIFIIANQESSCAKGGAGCVELGKPVRSADQSRVTEWESVYLKDAPEEYATTLCTGDELYCEAFAVENGSTLFFQSPENRLCEYKTDVRIGGRAYTGWFKKGTAEFCYGSGTCASSGVACSADADCRAGTGVCAVTRDSCTNASDCSGNQACVNTSADTCVITNPTYLVGGEYSGVWKNGDAQYDGWVGSCTPEWNGCSEFVDELDIGSNEFYGTTTGQSYFFVNNNRLNEDDLLGGQRCKGLVSQKLGCGLFRDTGSPALTSNASATYVASVHADTLYGGASYDLVRPIDCSNPNASTVTLQNGTRIDLCAQRCGYDAGLLKDLTGTGRSAYSKFSEEAEGGEFGRYNINDLWVFGGSCYTANDCAPMESEKGDLVEGACMPEVVVSLDQATNVRETVATPRLTNDSNRVLKVNRDRTCSEWLTCQSSRTVWDADAGTFRTVCDSVALCSEYAQNGDSSFCSEWNVDDAAKVFDAATYAARNTTWYGEEYSGYALPNQFGIQHLSQVDIAPAGLCNFGYTAVPLAPLACNEDSDCTLPGPPPRTGECEPNLENDFRLAFNAGTCEEPHGESCTVGTCSDDGSACSSDSQCASGTCTVGQCFVVSDTLCSDDSNCGAGQFCRSGSCVAEAGACDLNLSCGVEGATCFPSVATKTGSCFNDQCIVGANGTRLLAGEGELQICRAHPEVNSPFPNKVVEEWTSFDVSANKLREKSADVQSIPISGLAYTTKTGFENANFCAPGEACECSYKKLQSSTGSVSYVALDTTLNTIKKSLEQNFTASTALGDINIATTGTLGICSGGDSDGAFCLISGGGEAFGCGATSVTPGSASGFGGTCYAITREDSVVGLEGYCLERDSGININGDRNTGACLTWYPVDQLAGSTDLYAKDVEAGYFADAYICSDVRPFVNLKPSKSEAGASSVEVACANRDGGGNVDPENSHTMIEHCAKQARCPTGHFAVMGQPVNLGNVAIGSFANECAQFGTNDCPYTCVPQESYTATGEKCDPTNNAFWGKALSGADNSTFVTKYRAGSLDIYGWARPVTTANPDPYGDYTYMIQNTWNNCVARGIELLNPDGTPSTTGGYGAVTFPAEEEVGSGVLAKKIYYGYRPVFDAYTACRETLQVASTETSYAWTDRLLNPNSGFAINAQSAGITNPDLNYTTLVKPSPFGLTESDPTLIGREMPPIAVALCSRVKTSDNTQITIARFIPFADAIFTACTGGAPLTAAQSSGAGTDPSAPASRSFVDFMFDITTSVSPDPKKHGYVTNIVWSMANDPNPAAAFVNRATQLFANLRGGLVYQWQGSANMARKYTNGGRFVKPNDDVRVVGNPPQIISVDSRCYGSLCEEGRVGFMTLNGTDEGEKVGTKGFFRANLKFFVAADKNQLPLRRIVVDWGDGGPVSGSETANNYYKNRRGLVPGSQTQTYCDTASEWGMTADSCDPYPLDYSHNYFCSEVIATENQWTECDEGATNAPCIETNIENKLLACVYRPAVHIRDNWGWCSGVCTGGDDDQVGCFENDRDTLNTPNDINQNAECAYMSFPDFAGSPNDPWVYYNGVIRVEPTSNQ